MVLWPLDGWILLPVVGLVEGSGSKVSAKQWATFQLHILRPPDQCHVSIPMHATRMNARNECNRHCIEK